MTDDTKIRIVNILYYIIEEQLKYMRYLINAFHRPSIQGSLLKYIEELQHKLDDSYVAQDIDTLVSLNSEAIYYKSILNQKTQNILMDSFSYNQLVDHIITARIKEQLKINNLTQTALFNKIKEQINYTRVEDLEDIDVTATILSPETIKLFLYYLLINGGR